MSHAPVIIAPTRLSSKSTISCSSKNSIKPGMAFNIMIGIEHILYFFLGFIALLFLNQLYSLRMPKNGSTKYNAENKTRKNSPLIKFHMSFPS